MGKDCNELASGAETLSFEGVLEIHDAQRMQNEILQAFERNPGILIDLTQVVNIDIACLQVICSSHKTALKRGKTVCLKTPYSEGFKDAIVEAGLGRHMGCTKETEGNCFWLEKNLTVQ